MIEKHCDSNYKYSHEKSAKSFAKALCKALDIKQRIGQNSQLHSFTASQLRASCAQIKQSISDKFSHIKKHIRDVLCRCAFFLFFGNMRVKVCLKY